MKHKLKSLVGLFPVDNAWILVYPSPNNPDGIIKEHYDKTDQGIIELLYAIKENCLYHFNSKHNIYNIIIEKKKVKK